MTLTEIIANSASFFSGLIIGIYFTKTQAISKIIYYIRTSVPKSHVRDQNMRASLHELYQRAVELMKENNLFLTDLGEEDFVAMLGTNRVYLSRALKMYAKCGYPTFVNNLRVQYIMNEFIKNPNLSASDMAAMAGFNSLTAFTRPFREVTGLTPGKWCIRYRLTGQI